MSRKTKSRNIQCWCWKKKQTNKQTDHYSLKREKEVKNVEVSDAGYFLESNDQEEKENRMIARRQRLLWFG
jgi:hypothetical protein